MAKKALLVGINDYEDEMLNLSGCIQDVKDLTKVLERNGDGTPNFCVKQMLDPRSSGEVMEGLQALFGGDDEMALFYYSGHGYVNNTGAEIVTPEDLHTQGSYYQGLQMKDILQVVNHSRVKHKIVILDCCNAGNMGRFDINNDGSWLANGVTILTACREEQAAVEIEDRGLFTRFLCRALSGGAADYAGHVNMGGIYAYVDSLFSAWDQRPMFKSNVAEFASLRTVQPKVPYNVIRDIVTLFPDKDEEHQLNSDYEFTNSPEYHSKLIEPYADEKKVAIFKKLQKLQSIGFVEPVGAEHMYFAAMNRQTCRLTEVGKFYWELVKLGRI